MYPYGDLAKLGRCVSRYGNVINEKLNQDSYVLGAQGANLRELLMMEGKKGLKSKEQ